MKRAVCFGIPLLFCCLSPPLSAQTIVSHPRHLPRYVVLDTRKISTMKQELTLAAMQGYRVVLVAPRPGGGLMPPGMTVIMERVPEGTAAPEYWIASEVNAMPLDPLNLGARNSYHYVKRSAFQHRGHDFWGDFASSMIWGEKHVDHRKYDRITSYVLMEKNRENAPSCRYRLEMADPSHGDQATKNQLGQGFQVVDELMGHLILEGCSDTARETQTHTADPAQTDAAERFLLLSTDNYKKRQKELEGAIARGFQLSHASGKWLSLAQADSTAAKPQYASLGAKGELELEKKLNSAVGSRMIPDTISRKLSFWSGAEYQVVTENLSSAELRYQYRVLRDKKDTDLQDRINEAAKKGYEVRGLTRDAMGITVILEKTITEDAPGPN